MVKTGADNITKGKKKKQAGDENGTFDAVRHAKIILDFLGQRFQRKFFKKNALVFLGIFLAIFALEIILRVASGQAHNLDPCQSLDENFHHVMIPNTTCQSKTAEWDILYKINSLGLRDEEAGNKKAGEFRILSLGDSFVQGYGVDMENSFPKQLEKKINERVNGKFKVINAGVIGYSPLVEYLYLTKIGLDFKPDMVILAFSLTDFWEDRKRFGELAASYPDLSEEELKEKIAEANVQFDFARINAPPTQSPTKIFAPQISYQIKQTLRDNFKIYASFADFVKKRKLPVQQDVYNQGNIDKDIVALIRGEKISDREWQKLWEVPMNSLLLANNLLRSKKIPFIVVAIGDAFQVSPDEWPGRSALGIPRDFGDVRGDFQDELAKRLEAFSIPFVNLLPTFRESDLFPLYYTHDGHWRNTGHELAAEIVFEYLQKSQFGQVK